jgi:hypothetical protein
MIPTANQAGHRLHDSVDILAIDEIATSSTGVWMESTDSGGDNLGRNLNVAKGKGTGKRYQNWDATICIGYGMPQYFTMLSQLSEA